MDIGITGSCPMAFDLSQWLPAWLTVGSLFVVVYFLRDRIANFFDARAQHYFNEQLERLKNQLSRSAQEIEALRSSVLGLREQRQATIERRRLQAIDQLWAAVKELSARKGAAEFMAIVKFEAVAERAKSDRQIRELFGAIGGAAGKDIALNHQAHEAQPYVTPLAWALFDAYQSAINYLNGQLAIIKIGVGPEALKDPKDMIALISTALPEWKDRLDRLGTSAFPYAINELEKRLLAELRRMIAGDDNDAEQLAQATRISVQIEAARQTEREATAHAALAAGGVGAVPAGD